MREAIVTARSHAEREGKTLIANASAQLINDRFIKDQRITIDVVDSVRLLLSLYVSATKEIRDSSEIRSPYPSFDLDAQEAIVRYGNVELRVVENFLRDRSALELALAKIHYALDDEKAMYLPSRASNYLASDDLDWNLRTLITNAGFYPSLTLSDAATALNDWCCRYISALRQAWLATYPSAYPFYFGIQSIMREKFGESPRYAKHPSVFDFYNGLANKSVLFMSPLAHLAIEQYETGRIWSLFKDYKPKTFRLRGLSTWISTWPNRPHSSWSDTFEKMCDAVNAQYKAEPFDVFVSSCGSYGLPISDYVRRTFGCQIIYLGNITNAYFGIRQTATKNFMQGRINPEVWVEGDLGRFANLERIDGGRYV
jgi:hypothetical protein